MPWVDLSSDYTRQTVIAKGTPSLYNGHPTTLLLDDQRTVFCVWSNGHGGKASFMGISEDAGMNWKVHKTPTDWQNMSNCPSIYRMTDKKGNNVFLFSAVHLTWDTLTVKTMGSRGLKLRVLASPA